MTKQYNIVFTILILSFAIGKCNLPNGATWPNDKKVSPEDAVSQAKIVHAKELELTLSSEKNEYFVGEPIYVSVHLRNNGSQSQVIFGELRPSDGAIQIHLILPDGQKTIFHPLGHSDYDATAKINLEPDEVIGAVFPVFFGAKGWTFSQKGEYILTAIYQFSMGQGDVLHVESTPVKLILESEEGTSDFLVKEDIDSHQAGKFLSWQAGDHLENGKKKLQALLDDRPNSVVASYANFAFGKSLSEPFSDYLKGYVRPANCESAMKYLDRVNEAVITDYVRTQIIMARIRCELREENLKGAHRHLITLDSLLLNRSEYKALEIRSQEYKNFLKEYNDN